MPNQQQIQAELLQESASNGSSIRIVDEEGHLLFCYNPMTDCIEIKSSFRGGQSKKLYSINIFALRKSLLRAVLSDSPAAEAVAVAPKVESEVESLQSDISADA